MSEGEDRRASVPAIVAANTAASAASASASSAAGHASTASTQAGLAEGYSLAAGGFRDEAQTFRNQAEGFRNAADGFATASSASATSAEGFKNDVEDLIDDAEGFANEAKDYRDAASGHASSASGSATTAGGHASTAANEAALAGVARSGAEAAEENAEGFRDEAEGFRDEAESFKNAAAQSAEDAASVVLDGVPNASASVKGGIRLTGDLGGTWDSPTVPGLSAKVDAAYVAAQIAALVDSAPGVLDTLAEIANALGGDPNFAANMAAALANKANLDDPRFTDARTPTAHQHNASDINAGTLAFARLPTGTGASQVAIGNHTHTKSQVGLGNVDNTSDANKPISNAAQAALDGKAASSHSHSAADVASGTLDAARLPTVEKAKLAAGVQTSLDKADTASQLVVTKVADEAAWNSGPKTAGVLYYWTE
jgi:hypothetical protein